MSREQSGLWVVPLLLLVVALVVPRLGWDGLWYDELYSVANAGGAHFGPYSPAGIWERVVTEDPYQALGYPYTLAVWGAFAGWTEVATRTLSLLFALLALAVSYRLGREVASPLAGFFAALVIGLSSFFVLYAHEVRAFTMVAFFAALTLWSYARLLKAGAALPRREQALFVLGGVGLLYAHYAAAMLLMGLGLYHLLFVKKKRAWLQITGLALLMGVLFIPQAAAFLEGLTRYDPASVEGAPLSALGVVAALFAYISNNALLLAGAGFLAGAVFAVREAAALRMVIVVSLVSLLVLLLANEVLQILEPARLRYAVFLWPPLAVWLGAGLAALVQWARRRLPAPILGRAVLVALSALWLAHGLVAYNDAAFTEPIAGDIVPRLRTTHNVLSAHGSEHDLFAFYNATTQEAWYIRLGLEYITAELPMPTIFTASLYDINPEHRAWAAGQLAASQRVWYGVNRTIALNDVHDDFLALLDEEGFVFCETFIAEHDASLALYARTEAFCPGDPTMHFGEAYDLHGYDLSHEGDTLRVQLGWEQHVAADLYSAGVYVMPAGQVALRAQADSGFSEGAFVPMTLSVDLSDLDPGTYDVWLAVYDWRTGERLLGQDQVMSTQSDLLRLGQIERE